MARAFVILAAMRTGSNLLEERLARSPDLVCHGEAFNPHFLGRPGNERILGIDRAGRDADPLALIGALKAAEGGLHGFRLFPDHDRRAIAAVLPDREIAKIVLTRDPAESFVSLEIARATGQWWLGDDRRARRARIRFDPAGFAVYLDDLRAHAREVERVLQETGQAAFRIAYPDLGRAATIAGACRFLGAAPPADGAIAARVQNPAALEEKVENPEEMAAALREIGATDPGRLPDFEPDRGPGVPGFLASDAAGLLYMPLRGSDTGAIEGWLGSFGAPAMTGLRQKALRRWKRASPGHRSFTVVEEPLARAHRAFSVRILGTGPEGYPEIRALLRERYGLPVPEHGPGPGWTAADHRRAFGEFLEFLKSNLAGQTPVRVDPDWAGQAGLLRELARVMVPDRVLRRETLGAELAALAGPAAPAFEETPDPGPVALPEIRDEGLIAAAHAAYARDYMMFGYP